MRLDSIVISVTEIHMHPHLRQKPNASEDSSSSRLAAQKTCSRGMQPRFAVPSLTATLLLLLTLASEAAAATPMLFKDVKPLSVQLAAAAGSATLKVLPYALPQDVQVLTMPAPGGKRWPICSSGAH